MNRLLSLFSLCVLIACSQPNTPQPTIIPVPAAEQPTPAARPTKPPSYPAILPTATIAPEPQAKIGEYLNRELGIQLSYPKDWTVGEPESVGQLAWFYPERDEVYVLLYETAISRGTTIAQAAREQAEYNAGGLTDVQTIRSEQQVLADGSAAWVSEFTAVRDSGEQITVLLSHASRGTRLVSLLSFGPIAGIDSHRKAIEALTQSLQLGAPLRYGIPEDQALLTIGGESDNPRLYDPAHAGGDYLVYSGLTAFTPDMQLEGDLAEGWDISADGTVYTFYLRRNAVFHNGRPVTAADVIYSWERAADPATDSDSVLTYLGDIVGVAERHSGEAQSIRGLRAIDDHTLEVQLDAAKPYFPMKLCYITTFIVDKANIERGETWYRNPNGTGPFRLIRWEEGKVRIYESNKRFYLGAPKLPFIIEQIYAGVPLRLYETGDLDTTYIGGFDLERARDPQGPFAGQLHSGVSMCTGYIGIDSSQPPFDDPNVRHAFALAVDRQRLADLGRDGDLVAQGLYPPALPGYLAQLQGQRFDPAAAKQALAASRYPSAAALPPIVFTSSGFGSSISSYQAALAEMWQRHLGISIRFENIEPNRWSEVMHSGQHGQLYSYGWCADYPDPENFADALFHSGAQQNLGGYEDAELDAILEQARTEPNVQKRMALYQQAEQRIVDQAAAIFLTHSSYHQLIQPRIQGWVATPIRIPIERHLAIEE
jgi:oligopeptide transport system substrate-binding protein